MPAGSPWPFGVQWVEPDESFSFSLYSKHATGVTLLCYTEQDRPDATTLRQRRSLSDGLQETCRPHQSVNFVTAHDGFCLYDLVAYDRKHNEANGHGNTDGTDVVVLRREPDAVHS